MELLFRKKSLLAVLLIIAVLATIGSLNYRFFKFLNDYLALVIMALVYILSIKVYHYLKNDFLLFIGYSLSIIGAVFFFQVFINQTAVNDFLAVKSMVGSGFPLLESIALSSAPFFIQRKFSATTFYIGAVLLIVIIFNLIGLFGGEFFQSSLLGLGCGIILILGSINLFIQHRQLNNSIFINMIGAMIILTITSFLEIVKPVITNIKFISELLRLMAYFLIYRGVAFIPYELVCQELKERVLIDQLTGLYNRRALWELAKREMALADREERFIGILLMDLDRFKFINDRYGHLAGDRMIQQFANILKSSIRETDIVCRLGGDEFVALLSLEEPNLQTISNRISEEVERWKAGDELAAKIGVSIGIGIKEPGKPKKLEEILREADHYMYREKSKKKPARRNVESGQFQIFT